MLKQGVIRRRPDEIEALLFEQGIEFTLIHTRPVYTCREAASARQVPLHNELKTLLVVYQDTLALLNLPGDRRIDRRLVQLALPAREFRLASVSEMAALQLTRGIISPLSLIGCRSLVDAEVLDLEWITTNAGSLTLGIKIGVESFCKMCSLEITRLSTASEV